MSEPTANMRDIAGRIVHVGDQIVVTHGDGRGRTLTVRDVRLGAVGRVGVWSARADDAKSHADSVRGKWSWSTWIEASRVVIVNSTQGAERE